MHPLASAFALLVALPAVAPAAQAPITGERPSAAKPFKAAEVASFDSPWALAFLPDGRMLVTEKTGRMLLLSADGRQRTAVTGVPEVNASGQGALGEVVAHPDFAANGQVYFSYSAPGSPNAIVLARGRLVGGADGARLDDVTTLYRAHPDRSGGHYAGRIAFSPDGHLFFSMGERQKFTPAQEPDGVLGKIVRLTMDGRPAPGNPLAAKSFDPAIWSYGHRNPLGLAFDGKGRLWDAEMGPKGGDEVNLILPGRNYGWPLVSNGDHYDGKPIPDHPTRPDLEAPRVSWNPSISPSSLLVYSGGLFPKWRGKALVGALSGKALILVALGDDGAREEARYDMGQRIRAVDQGPDGAVYVLEDGKGGRLLKLSPAS
ncbi:PQQ-dependent sugar dehydrogenase [Rhizorhabdus dicambivorans]|uniref:Dehydrogenase n=1 Tax=Rhizorhabdus dicambivorans TaxID=1850238 RepID=A0A2A4FW54_9SPHN|nr:PQQ-dependent sugar dehydrogenase [Rhizorhabdus dicambivorans]ATE65569.1 dehydrogenase [Rhizorhabdus dicambivorans]PCE41912.1 dehydrogenase [Rhizorhabdus dicambivorans]